MAMIQISNTGTTSDVITAPAMTYVQSKKDWKNDDWEDVDYLRCLEIKQSLNPTMSSATFLFAAGKVKEADLDAFKEQALLELKGQFVRVMKINPPDPASNNQRSQATAIWVGIVAEESIEYGEPGQQNVETDDVPPYVNQTFTAYGLEYLLSRAFLTSAYVDNSGTAQEVETIPRLNVRYKNDASYGNRSTDKIDTANINDGKKGSDGSDLPARDANAYIFSDDAALWTIHDVVEYLLEYHDKTVIGFNLGGQLDALDVQAPPMELAGKSITQVFDELIDRKRGLAWYVATSQQAPGDGESDESAATTVEIRICTTVGETFSMDGFTLPANKLTASVRLSDSTYITPPQLKQDNFAHYERIVVRGDPLRVMFTISAEDKTLVPAWTTDEQTKYLNAVGSTSPDQNDILRSSDQYAHVFTTFKLPDDWNWIAAAQGDDGDPDGGDEGNQTDTPDTGGRDLVAVAVNDGGYLPEDADSVKPSNIRKWARTLETHLPLRKEIADPAKKHDLEYLAPFALVKNGTNYEYAESSLLGSAHVRVLDRGMGIEVRGPLNWLAKNTMKFVPESPPLANATNTYPKLDFNDLIATVSVELDAHLQVVINMGPKPGDASDDGDDGEDGGGDNSDDDTADSPANIFISGVNDKLIVVQDAAFWYCLYNTVTGAQSGKLVHRTGPMRSKPPDPDKDLILRDDGPLLRRIALLAKTWYSKQRSSISMTIAGYEASYDVGSFITTWDDGSDQEDVNAVVSEKVYDLEKGETHIKANYSELDFILVAGG